MRKVNTTIKYIEPYSIAEDAEIEVGDKLISINGHDFHDILEYRYLTAEYEVTLEILKKDGTTEVITVENDYDDIGIEFEEGLIDEAQSCRNKCIFCFIDQLPKGMRETVYFKDDDTRLSFLQGNYVTLTNMSDEEIDRLIKMRVSPINVSVQATNPELRCKMLNNRFAGKCYDIMKKFAANNIYMNCQIVLCPEINDGKELDRSISELAALFPNVNSVSIVPVGLTRYRDGLYPLKPFTKETSAQTIKQVETWQKKLYDKLGTRLIYLSDEFYLNAELPIPDAEVYEGFPQLENGVGLIAPKNSLSGPNHPSPTQGKERHDSSGQVWHAEQCSMPEYTSQGPAHTGAADVVSYPSWRTAKRYEDWRAPFSKLVQCIFRPMTSCLAPWLQPHVRSVPDRFVKRQGTSWLHTRRKKK